METISFGQMGTDFFVRRIFSGSLFTQAPKPALLLKNPSA
jgi:hypothetical protein